MRIFKVKAFGKWCRQEQIVDSVLRQAVKEMELGLIDADLGSGVCKKRIPGSSRGKRGGGRTIVAFRRDHDAFFIYGFLKKERSDIEPRELKAIKQYAGYLFGLNDDRMANPGKRTL